jgi:hypothetical protein
MTHLGRMAEDYITIRRNMGFNFEDAAKLLLDFVELSQTLFEGWPYVGPYQR